MKTYQQTQLRWPVGLRDAVVAAAQASRRSINSEIVTRLEGTFPARRQGWPMPCACGNAEPVVGWTAKAGGAQEHFVHCSDCDTWAEAETAEHAIAAWNAVAQRDRGRA